MGIPTLVVGMGGTGVLTLRALKKLYEELPEKERVPASFLAYDFDRSALETGDEHGRFARLEDSEFLYLNPREIQDLLRNLDRVDGGGLAWENILRWFPTRSHVRIPVSEVEANGASQLRCLGRLGFFLNDELIESSLRRTLFAIETDPRNLSDHKRVILVSSVAGGTGAGMFIDMAYLARRQEIRPSVWAYLLLPEVFEDVDTGGRIFQNAYACLKELAYLKEQSIPFEARYPRIPSVDVPVGGEELFQRIFLARGEAVFSGADTIRRTTAQLAGTILAQLQRDIQEKCLSIASDNPSEFAQHEQQGKRMHAFGAASSSLIKLTPTKTLAASLFKSLQRFLGGYTERANLTDQLRQDIFRQRQRVFDELGSNTRNSGFALVMLPPKNPWPSRDRADLKAAISPILETRVLVEDYGGTKLWTYFEDIFHPLEGIKNIERYYRAYQQQQYRELFHIDRRMLENPIFRGANYVPCGNLDCYGDIEFLPRNERVCRYCDRPIRSRCGNPSCTANNLDLLENGAAKSCPACRGYNHAAWWVCKKHGKIDVDIPIAQERCPRCIEEHEKNPIIWPIHRISLRPDLLDRIICPRCADLAEMDPSYKPYVIPRQLVPFYRNGVNGHEESQFSDLIEFYHIPDGFRCPVCRTPIIPVHHERTPSLEGSIDSLLLFRQQGSHIFIAARDPSYRYDVLCGHCSFPLAMEDDQCPRCQRFLEDCAACSLVTHRKSLRAVPDPRTGGKTCSVCGVLRIPFGGEDLPAIEGSFCSNLFGCPAGGLLLQTEEFAVMPPRATLCPVCRDTAFRPLDLNVFLHSISHCLFCNNCLGAPFFANRAWAKQEEELLAVSRLQVPEKLNEQQCLLCARVDRPVDSANTSVIRVPEDGDLDHLVEVSARQYLKIVQLGRALIFSKEDRLSFRLTLAAWFALLPSRSEEEPISVKSVCQLLLGGTLQIETYKVLRSRLEALLSSWAQAIPSGVSYTIGGFSSEPVPTHSVNPKIPDPHPEESSAKLHGMESGEAPYDLSTAKPKEYRDMPALAPIRNQIFISYSRKDKKWLDRLRTMLKPLESNLPLHVWDDNDIRPGIKWKEEIRQALAAAKVAVLLISGNFLASEFITQEELPHLLQAAERDGVKIVWILLSQCPYEATPIGAYQAAHDPKQALDEMPKAIQNRVLSNLAKAILEAAS